MAQNETLRQWVMLSIFFVLNLASLALILAGLGSNDWTHNDASVLYPNTGESWKWSTDWGLLHAKISSSGGAVGQPDPRRPKLDSFDYADCATIPVPVECDYIYGIGIGSLILGIWAAITSLTTSLIAVYFFKAHHSVASWAACALSSFLASGLTVASILVWVVPVDDYISDFYPRLFEYDAIKASHFHQSSLRTGTGVWLLVAAAIASFVSIPFIYLSRKCFDIDSYAKFQQQYMHYGEYSPNDSKSKGAVTTNIPFGGDLIFTNVVPTATGVNAATTNAQTGLVYEESLQYHEPVTAASMRSYPTVTLQDLKLMNAHQVSSWFRGLGMSEDTCQAVARNNINGLSLLSVNPEALRTEFLGDGPRIMDLIAEIRARS